MKSTEIALRGTIRTKEKCPVIKLGVFCQDFSDHFNEARVLNVKDVDLKMQIITIFATFSGRVNRQKRKGRGDLLPKEVP
jgi:hypothetical protein